MNYIKDQDHHWIFHIAFHFLNTSSLCLDAFYIYHKLMSSYTLNFLIAKILEPKWLNLDDWWFEIHGPSRILGSSTCWGSNSTFLTLNSQHLQNLALWVKNAKFRCLVIWNQGPSGTMRSPTRWGSNSTFKTSNSKHPQNDMALWAKSAKFRCLVIWNRGPGGTMRSPMCWGSNSTFKT
jgi:hypothetical protein